MSEAKVRVSLVDGTLEFEGSETFVATQLEKFSEAIKAGLGRSEKRKSNETPATSREAETKSQATSGDLDDVFASTDTGVQILKDIPGNSNAQKMVNVAKLLLFGLKQLKQKDTVLFEDVKAACLAHGCYDGNNMSTVLKDEKEAFVFGGSGKKQTLRLTVPGTKSTAKLVAEIRAGSAEE